MASRSHARRLLGLADEQGVPAVLTAAVRHVDPGESAVVDVLDAARRLVALDTRHLDRVTDAAHLAGTDTMHAIAREVGVRLLTLNPIEGVTRPEAAEGAGYLELMAKGSYFGVNLATPDLEGTFAELESSGAEVVQVDGSFDDALTCPPKR